MYFVIDVCDYVSVIQLCTCIRMLLWCAKHICLNDTDCNPKNVAGLSWSHFYSSV